MASSSTAIEWTDKTWNPTTGCNKVSPGCKHCYAETLTKRFKNHFENGFQFTIHPDRLDQPKRWRKPSRIFVNSMSDLFHEEMPLDFLQQVFAVMNETPQHIFQVLTKRHERMLELAGELLWTDNIWLGVSVENQKYTHRVDFLRRTPAHVKFLSCEPLLGPLDLDLHGIDWVITGGESGRGHRPIEVDWVRSIRDQCLQSDVAFFHKQWGGLNPKSGGRELDGVTWDQFPTTFKTPNIQVLI
ncbi:phage Gp37/Gp68 family protein [Deinococcus aluminii]|uniref:Phage Gp37/Gp68 family protein n=1 Tax=Deinococcus aluminii TaxID=1656885 RepID=A0ABP9XIF9_9DEIO